MSTSNQKIKFGVTSQYNVYLQFLRGEITIKDHYLNNVDSGKTIYTFDNQTLMKSKIDSGYGDLEYKYENDIHTFTFEIKDNVNYLPIIEFMSNDITSIKYNNNKLEINSMVFNFFLLFAARNLKDDANIDKTYECFNFWGQHNGCSIYRSLKYFASFKYSCNLVNDDDNNSLYIYKEDLSVWPDGNWNAGNKQLSYEKITSEFLLSFLIIEQVILGKDEFKRQYYSLYDSSNKTPFSTKKKDQEFNIYSYINRFGADTEKIFGPFGSITSGLDTSDYLKRYKNYFAYYDKKNDLQKDLEDKKNFLEGYRQVITDNIAERKLNESKIIELEEAIENCNAKIAVKENNIDNLNGENDELVKELKKKQVEIEENIKLVNEFKKKQDQLKSEFQNQIGEKNAENTNLSIEMNKIRAEIEKKVLENTKNIIYNAQKNNTKTLNLEQDEAADLKDNVLNRKRWYTKKGDKFNIFDVLNS